MFGFSIPLSARYVRAFWITLLMSSSPALKLSNLFSTKIYRSLDCLPPTFMLSATSVKRALSSLMASWVALRTYKTSGLELSDSIRKVAALCSSFLALLGPGVSTKTRDTSSEETKGILPWATTLETLESLFRTSIAERLSGSIKLNLRLLAS